jgi:Fe-S-cluster containining protein
MYLIEDHPGAGESGADALSHENFIQRVYRDVDKATAGELDRLRDEEGIVPTCRLGCSHCCRFHIPINAAEAYALAQYIKRESSPEQIGALRKRTQRWHEWERSLPGRLPSGSVDPPAELADYDPCCPLLVDGVCSAYAVRPVVCRTHFVRTHSLVCRAANDPTSAAAAPVSLPSVVAASRSSVDAIKERVEALGLDFSRSIMLLPYWLAHEMGWDFGGS